MKNIAVVTFDVPSTAYQALSTLKELDLSGRLSLKSAVVVERQANGQPVVRDEVDAMKRFGTEPGGSIGTLIGILADPASDTATYAAGGGLIATVTDLIPAGSTALVAEVDEYAVEVVDGAMGQLGGFVTRQATDDVNADVATAKDAHKTAEKESKSQERAESRQQHQEERTERQNKLIDSIGDGLDRMEHWVEGRRQPVAAGTDQ